MEEIFVTNIRINKVRHLEGLTIPLSETERKHLILTGKNGSGKTSVLDGINTFLNWVLTGSANERELNEIFEFYEKYKEVEREVSSKPRSDFKPQRRANDLMYMSARSNWGNRLSTIAKKGPVQLFSNFDIYNQEDTFQKYLWPNGSFIIKYFKSKRNFEPKESLGPQKIELKDKYEIDENANDNFVRQLVNLRLDLLDAKDTGKTFEVDKLEEWFKKFENVLKNIFDDELLKLVFDRPNFNYNIISQNKEPFNLNQLSDGYAAFLSIVSEIMMRMDRKFHNTSPYDLQGIVLIDEIETHLHIDLQKKILPFLTSFFPKIQFIVTTHSPFVLSSIDNAVIYDLEKQIRVEDLSGYSVEGVIESYFDNDKYSQSIKDKLSEYETLIKKPIMTEKEQSRIDFLEEYFDELPDFLSPELQVKIQQLKLDQLV
jgi:predicted ATPase